MQNDDLFIYKDFVLQGKIQNFISLKWTRRFNDTGEFSLALRLNRENIDLITKGDIIYKGIDGEAAFIEDIVSNDASNSFTVSGRFLSGLLDERYIDYQKATDIKTVINEIVTQNFIAADNPNRNIGFLRILPYNLTVNPSLSAEFKNQTALEAIKKICKDNNIGFKIIYNPKDKTFDFTLYQGKKTSAEFSENYKNIDEQDYYYQTRGHKNTCLISFNGGNLIYGNSNKGLDRREVCITADSKATEASAMDQARLYLLDRTIIQSFDTVINSKSPQFIYKTDWDLGDIVSNKSELWGVTIEKNVLEVTEYFDKSGTNLAPIFGDTIPIKN